MKRDGRFYVGLVGVAAVVTFLVWTGIDKAMVYYLTPVELMAKVAVDDSFHDVGVKVSGRVVKGSWERGKDAFDHTVSSSWTSLRMTSPSPWNTRTSFPTPSTTRPKSSWRGGSAATASSRPRRS